MALSEAPSLHPRIRTKRARLALQECAGDKMVSWGLCEGGGFGDSARLRVCGPFKKRSGRDGRNYPAAVQCGSSGEPHGFAINVVSK